MRETRKSNSGMYQHKNWLEQPRRSMHTSLPCREYWLHRRLRLHDCEQATDKAELGRAPDKLLVAPDITVIPECCVLFLGFAVGAF